MRTFFIKRPILTNTIVFAGLYSAGDISVQTFITKNEKYDWKSTARYVILIIYSNSITDPAFPQGRRTGDPVHAISTPRICQCSDICATF